MPEDHTSAQGPTPAIDVGNVSPPETRPNEPEQSDSELSQLHAEVEDRFGVLPNFFRLAPESPEIIANLWGFARFAYLDNPLPSLFKERLFVSLSRFCDVRYCIARHAGFLAGLGRPSGDAGSPVHTVDEIIRLIRRPFPRAEHVEPYVSQCAACDAPLSEMPKPDSAMEEAVFACATHVFLQTGEAPNCLAALRHALGESLLQHLMVFLAFVRTAHYWTKVHADLTIEEDLKHLLATQQTLAECLINDPEAGLCEVSQKLMDELAALRKRERRHNELSHAHEALRQSEERLRRTNTELNERILELQKANAEVQRSRRAALNLMEDAVQSRQAVETLNVELRESEERFRSLVSVITDVPWISDATGAFTQPQPAWEAYTGQTWEEYRGSGWANAVHPDDRERVNATWRRACESGTLYEIQGRVWHAATQQWRHYVARATPLFAADGAVREWVGSCTDIEGLKRTEESLRRLNDELEARVEDRTRELVASQNQLRGLAAELNITEQRERQRLAAELHDYLAQLLALSKIKLAQAKQQAAAPSVVKVVTDVQQVLDQALTYTRALVAQLSPPILKEFGLPMALKWLAEQMQERDLTVSLELERDTLLLPEDQAMLLFQSVRELLMNVVKHGQTKRARVTVAETGGVLRIAVTDQGTGFDPAAVGTSAVPSFGLFSIRERMKALGGRFELRSQPGQGTTAILVLPLGGAAAGDVSYGEPSARHSSFVSRIPQSNDASPDTLHDHRHSALGKSSVLSARSKFTQDSPPSTQPSRPAVRVLLADDHAMVRQGLKSILDAYQDISVIGEAADGEEAVVMSRSLAPDVIIMDVNMPKMDGIEATRRIKAQQPSTLVVGLSLAKSSQVEPLLLQAGASSYVSKDAAADRLYEAIISAVKRS